MSRCHFLFYATAADLGPLLLSLEARERLQYTRTGLFESNELQVYLSYTDIPDFGLPDHPTATVGPSFLVAVQGTAVHARPVPQRDGGVRFSVGQKLNNDTVVFWPGGRYGTEILLYGQIGTISASATSQYLYNRMAKLFRKHFMSVNKYLVGPEAFSLGKGGVRLTLSASTPPDFDLRLQ
jgi:hypothetical protein